MTDDEKLCSCGRWISPHIVHGNCESHIYVWNREYNWRDAPTEYLIEIEHEGESLHLTIDETETLIELLQKASQKAKVLRTTIQVDNDADCCAKQFLQEIGSGVDQENNPARVYECSSCGAMWKCYLLENEQYYWRRVE